MGKIYFSFGKRRPSAAIGAAAAFGLTLLVFFGALYLWYLGSLYGAPTKTNPAAGSFGADAGKIEQSTSEESFRSWLAAADAKAQYASGVVNTFAMRSAKGMGMDAVSEIAPAAAPSAMVGDQGSEDVGGPAERIGETNVQVAGIDEPDVLKTDGQEIYFAPQPRFYLMRSDVMLPEAKIMPSGIVAPPYYKEPTVKVIAAFPPKNLKLSSEIKHTGEMLLSDKTLAVFDNGGVYAYDVSDPAAPKDAWTVTYQNNSWPVAERLKDGKLYLILGSSLNRAQPCPYVLATAAGQDVSVACGAIWHPVMPEPSDVTYTVMKMDMKTGAVENSVSFVASYAGVVYMSTSNIYLTYNVAADTFKFIVGFLNENPDLVPTTVRDRLNKVASYDISNEAKVVELQQTLTNWRQSLSEDDTLQLSNNLQNRLGDYFSKHRRDVLATGIVRINDADLKVAATGVVPGAPLNQFSLDESGDYLRMATTTSGLSGLFWQFGFNGGGNDSVSDVYVLDANLRQVGTVMGMGNGERIYAVRFIGDMGYVVTFKETDPLYVLDLSNPRQPEIKGELKIPGYSSYLHPLADNMVLGIGREDTQVKLSLFDVSNPSAPVERSKYTLKENWSDVLNNHHAFMLDTKQQIFFVPGGEGGYIFSYKNNELSLKKAVSGLAARRAVFLDDYLYVVGDQQIVVLDEKDWSRVKELNLE